MFSTKAQGELSAGRVSAIKAQFEKLDAMETAATATATAAAQQTRIVLPQTAINNKRFYLKQMSYPQTNISVASAGLSEKHAPPTGQQQKICFKTTNKLNNMRASVGAIKTANVEKPGKVTAAANSANAQPKLQLKPAVPLKSFRLPRSATSLELTRSSKEQLQPLWRQPLQLQSKEANIHHNLRKSCQLSAASSVSSNNNRFEPPNEATSKRISLHFEKLPLLGSHSSPPPSTVGNSTLPNSGQYHGNNNNNSIAFTTPTCSQQQQLTRDAVKRNSIKRSPAFRVGDKQNNAVLLKQLPVAVAAVMNANSNNNK